MRGIREELAPRCGAAQPDVLLFSFARQEAARFSGTRRPGRPASWLPRLLARVARRRRENRCVQLCRLRWRRRSDTSLRMARTRDDNSAASTGRDLGEHAR